MAIALRAAIGNWPMFAKRRKLSLRNGSVVYTPLLVPSFSSKTFQDEQVAQIIEYMATPITDEILISAYDLYYGEIKKKITFPSLVFLDSGGYEASDEIDLSDTGKKKRWAQALQWTIDRHKRVLRRWDYDPPTVIVSFDSPRAKTNIAGQIARARRLFKECSKGSSELLFKTENKKQRFLNIEGIIQHKHELAGFDVIGVTEKELGVSTLDRMLNIARLRMALGSIGLETPIHVFGSLDAISSPLYFFAGADIFDGLAWLRYAFHEGTTIYKHNYGATILGIGFEDFRVNVKVWNDNYFYLFHLKEDMAKFLLDNKFDQFRHVHNAKFFATACAQFQEKLKELK